MFDRAVADFTAKVNAFVAQRGARAEPPTDWEARVRDEEIGVVEEELRTAIAELEAQNDELVRATAELEAEQARYRDLFENAPDAYFVTTTKGTIREANPAAAAARLLNVPPRFLVDKVLLHFVARQDARTFREAMRALSRDPARVTLDVRLRPRRGGRVVLISLAATPVRIRDATVLLRWLARPAREAAPPPEIAEVRDQSARAVALVRALRVSSSDAAAREATLAALEQLVLDQAKLLDALVEPTPASAPSSPTPPPPLPSPE